ncbi:MAG: HD domain-containing phosphohydrolase [Microcystaceae cyanobacterium]
MNNLPSAQILVIDHHLYSRLATVDILKLDNYDIRESDGDGDILAEIKSLNPDLLLLEMMLPTHNGLEVCRILKNDPQTAMIPVILMTVMDDTGQRRESRKVGADAYLLKPLERVELLTRVDLLIQKKRLSEWVDQIEQVLFRIAEVIEERHSDKISNVSFSQLIQAFGAYLALDQQAKQDLIFAARLHDLGTVAIPKSVMLKPGKLTEAERSLIQEHVIVGEKIFQPLAYRRDVGKVIRHHHERWDGTGYPDGLKGSEIPYLAQVFQILDIYDALTRNRSYQAAVSTEEAIAILQKEANQGWRNPQLVEQFTSFIAQSDLFKSLLKS